MYIKKNISRGLDLPDYFTKAQLHNLIHRFGRNWFMFYGMFYSGCHSAALGLLCLEQSGLIAVTLATSRANKHTDNQQLLDEQLWTSAIRSLREQQRRPVGVLR